MMGSTSLEAVVEDPQKLKLVREGVVSISTGKMCIIDPGYTKDVDYMNWFERFYTVPFELTLAGKKQDQVWGDLTEELRKLNGRFKKVTKDNIGEYLEGAKGTTKIMDKLKGSMQQRERYIARCKRQPKFVPPFLVQGRNGVYLRTPDGDGGYPVTRWKDRYVVHLTRFRKKDNAIDWVGVDVAMMMIADASKVRTVKDAPFCEVEVPNGKYRCRFTRCNYTLNITPASRKV